MSRIDPRLDALRRADLVLWMAGRDRPAAPRCTLADRRSLPPLPDQTINEAISLAARVVELPEPARTIIAMAMATDRGEPVYSQKSIAEKIGISPRSVNSYFRSALNRIFEKVKKELA